MRWAGILLVLGSAFCFSTMGTIVKDAYDHGASATGLLAVRMLVAGAIWLVVLNRRLVAIDWGSRSVRRLAFAGVVGVALASLAEYASYRYLPVAMVVVILFMAPVWVAVGEWILTRKGVGMGGVMGLVFLGVGLVLLTEARIQGASWAGIALALMASLGIAIFFTLAGSSIAGIGSVRSAAVVAVASLWIVVPVSLVDRTFFSSLGSQPIMLRGTLLGIVATVISLALLLSGVRLLGAFRASVVSAVEPVFAGLLAWWFLGELLSPLQILGALLVIGGTIAVEGTRTREERLSTAVV